MSLKPAGFATLLAVVLIVAACGDDPQQGETAATTGVPAATTTEPVTTTTEPPAATTTESVTTTTESVTTTTEPLVATAASVLLPFAERSSEWTGTFSDLVTSENYEMTVRFDDVDGLASTGFFGWPRYDNAIAEASGNIAPPSAREGFVEVRRWEQLPRPVAPTDICVILRHGEILQGNGLGTQGTYYACVVDGSTLQGAFFESESSGSARGTFELILVEG